MCLFSIKLKRNKGRKISCYCVLTNFSGVIIMFFPQLLFQVGFPFALRYHFVMLTPVQYPRFL